jgi:hypothetical protein
MLKWLVSLFDHRGDARAAAHNDDAAGLVHSIDDVQQPPCPPPPVKRKANCRGAAANAKKLKAVGGGGQFRNTAAMVAAMSLDEQPVLDGGLEPAEAEARSPLRPKRAGYQGLRVDMSHRLSKQAAPLVEPVPRVPAPWVAALDHGGRRDWASMAAHIARCVGLAVGREVNVLVVHAGALCGPLRFNAAIACSDGRPSVRSSRTCAPQEAEARRLQESADAADVLCVHDDIDVLLLAPRAHVVEAMRAELARRGHEDALRGVTEAAALDESVLEWMRAQPCPNGGSSHTGITVDFGLHDGQLNGSDRRALLRGGDAQRMATRRPGTPSSRRLRADAYQMHRRALKGETRRGGRFAKLGQTRSADKQSTRADSGDVQLPMARLNSYPCVHEPGWLSCAALDRRLRGAAADLSAAFFAAVPGVDALLRVQRELAHAARELGGRGGCPFNATHLYPKGSMGLMAVKNGHDDRNGPACLTAWQNLGAAESGARLQLVVVCHGYDVVLDAPEGQFALFAAWLPHLTRTAADGPSAHEDDWRLHHTAYCRYGTETFAWVAREYREVGLPIATRRTGG